MYSFLFFFNAPPTTEIYTLSLHDALPICRRTRGERQREQDSDEVGTSHRSALVRVVAGRAPTVRRSPSAQHEGGAMRRSEEHTSELQSRLHLVCRLLLEKKKTMKHVTIVV